MYSILWYMAWILDARLHDPHTTVHIYHMYTVRKGYSYKSRLIPCIHSYVSAIIRIGQ